MKKIRNVATPGIFQRISGRVFLLFSSLKGALESERTPVDMFRKGLTFSGSFSAKRFAVCLAAVVVFNGAFFTAASQGAEPVVEGEKVSQEKKAPSGENFSKGYTFFEKGKFKEAAPFFQAYLKNHSSEDEEYNWAEFFLGVSLKKIGFSHASVDILSHLVSRNPDPRIIQYVFEIFESIARGGPFDREALNRETISGKQYAFLEGKTADFVHFYQGVYDWENGFVEWGEEHFDRIKRYTYYYYKSLYEKALYNIYKNRVDDALTILWEILEGRKESEELHNEVRQTIARLLYERGRYEESLEMYQKIDDPMEKQPKNLIERAWNQFRLGNPEKAMGLLYAYSSPAFKNSFTAEYFLLKSLIYKDVCHYKSALSVVSEFRKHYSESLNLIYARGEAEEDLAMLGVLLKNKRIKEVWDFIGVLEKEKEQVDFKDGDFRAFIEKSYTLQLEESAERLRELVTKEYENIADQLLHYEEKASLMEYEIGIDISQRAVQFHFDEDEEKEKREKDLSRGVAVYPFQGEFWSDELANYRVTLENKCSGKEEWDIFLN